MDWLHICPRLLTTNGSYNCSIGRSRNAQVVDSLVASKPHIWGNSVRWLHDFDWKWPRKVDRAQIEDLFTLDFVAEGANVVVLGPNGVGKTMIAQNLCYQAVLHGVPTLFTTASALLADLSERHTSYALQQRLRHYARPKLLCIDEIGYLTYDARAADLLFEVINRRYQRVSTIISTNKAFGHWHEIFASATSVVTLIDRLTHQAEILSIEGESYRLKESRERAENKQLSRRSQRKKSSAS